MSKVWYVAYGSNLLESRFKLYIEGGRCEANGKTYAGCADKTPPAASRPVELPYSMFYGNYGIGSWKDSAVCFLDLEKPGRALGRAWLITEEQLHDVHRQEGMSSAWYPTLVKLEDIDGIPAYTLGNTEKKHEPFENVGDAYAAILRAGLRETCPAMTAAEIERYLVSCGE